MLQDEGFLPAADADSRWRNLVRFYKRLESDEVPGARLRARFRGVEKQAVANAEGYFKVELQPSSLQPGPWQEVELELLEPRAGIQAIARVLVPPQKARFGVISDIEAHAAAEGLIQASELRAVRSEKEFEAKASKAAASSGALK